MNYRALNYIELERFAYANGDQAAIAELARSAVESEEAFEEKEQECEQALTDADDWKARYEDVKADIERVIGDLDTLADTLQDTFGEDELPLRLLENAIEILKCAA